MNSDKDSDIDTKPINISSNVTNTPKKTLKLRVTNDKPVNSTSDNIPISSDTINIRIMEQAEKIVERQPLYDNIQRNGIERFMAHERKRGTPEILLKAIRIAVLKREMKEMLNSDTTEEDTEQEIKRSSTAPQPKDIQIHYIKNDGAFTKIANSVSGLTMNIPSETGELENYELSNVTFTYKCCTEDRKKLSAMRDKSPSKIE